MYIFCMYTSLIIHQNYTSKIHTSFFNIDSTLKWIFLNVSIVIFDYNVYSYIEFTQFLKRRENSVKTLCKDLLVSSRYRCQLFDYITKNIHIKHFFVRISYNFQKTAFIQSFFFFLIYLLLVKVSLTLILNREKCTISITNGEIDFGYSVFCITVVLYSRNSYYSKRIMLETSNSLCFYCITFNIFNFKT